MAERDAAAMELIWRNEGAECIERSSTQKTESVGGTVGLLKPPTRAQQGTH